MARPVSHVLAFALCAGAGFASCGDGASVQRDCFARIWVPRSTGARIAMERTGWEPTLVALPYDADWGLLRLALPPGEYGYSLVRGARPELDPRNPLTTFREDDGSEVSLLVVDDCDAPGIKVESHAVREGQVEIEGRFLAARSASPVDPSAIRVTTTEGDALAVEVVDAALGTFRARGAVGEGRTTIAVEASDDAGIAAEPTHVRVWPSRRATDRRDEVLYQVVVDRFRGDGGLALAPPTTPGSRAGGTLDGVRTAIEDGTFERMGVTSLWLSPVYDNPDDARVGRDGRYYEGYHGYWVQNGRSVEPRIGGDEALRSVVSAAHARGLAVLLDIVPNHVDETNPVRVEHEADGWFNPPGCVCGSEDCPWGPNLQTCWFTPYLPDLHLQKSEVARYEADEARFWLTDFDVDGVRLDAVPMMPRASTRRIALALRETVAAGEEPFIVGEVFTGPGAAALEEIRAQIGPDGLSSAFAFPLMWALRSSIASGGGFDEVESILLAEEDRFAGSGVIVGRILDNHDVSRFVSVANGDDGGDPWDDPAVQPEDAAPYERLAVGLTAIFTLPGMPTVFQGDEVGLAGSNDPDNRRVMPGDDALAPEQLALRAHTERLGTLRRCSSALRRGDRRALVVDGARYAYVRETEEESAIVALSSQDSATTVAVAPPGAAGATWIDALTGDAFAPDGDGMLAVELGPRTSRVLLAADDPCLAE